MTILFRVSIWFCVHFLIINTCHNEQIFIFLTFKRILRHTQRVTVLKVIRFKYSKLRHIIARDITGLQTPTEVLGNGEVVPPAGTYLVNTFMAFRSSNGDGDAAGNINNAIVIVEYGNIAVNNQTY